MQRSLKHFLGKWVWPGGRLLALSGLVLGLGFLYGQHFPHHPQPDVPRLCIVAGFLSLTVLAPIRIAIPRFRRRLRSGVWSTALLCALLLAMQVVEAVWNTPAPGRYDPPVYSRIVYRNMLWLLPWLLIHGLAYLALARLWAARAYEVTIGSALFWFWSVAHFVVGLHSVGRGWGVTFWGSVWE